MNMVLYYVIQRIRRILRESATNHGTTVMWGRTMPGLSMNPAYALKNMWHTDNEFCFARSSVDERAF